MSATLPSRHEPSRHSWWNRSLKSSSRSLPRLPLDRPQTSDSSRNHLTFHAFASVIGLKSKKIPPREPSSSSNVLRPIDNWDILKKSSGAALRHPTVTRPSTATTLSRVDTAQSRAQTGNDTEPRARRNSLLTLADDPFAPQPQPLPPSGKDQLNTPPIHGLDPQLGLPLQNEAGNLSNPSLATASVQQRPAEPSVSMMNANREVRKAIAPELSRAPTRQTSDPVVRRVATNGPILKSRSMSTLTGNSRSIPPRVPLPTPKNKSTTDTDARPSTAPSQPTQSYKLKPFSSKESPPHTHSSLDLTNPTNRRIRQPSINRIPVRSAPPTANLPPPPKDRTSADSNWSSQPSTRVSSSSMASNDEIGEYYVCMLKEKPTPLSDPSSLDKAEVSSVRSAATTHAVHGLKKSYSHHSLSKQALAQASFFPSPPTDDMQGYTKLRKQRSFHQTLMPTPPTALRQLYATSAPLSQSSLPTFHGSGLDRRRGSTSGASVSSNVSKRRLFPVATMRRPSVSQPPEEDVRSIFSLRSESQSMRAPPAVQGSPESSPIGSSFWDEDQPSPASLRLPTPVEYMPQQIMSPADMLKVEASVMMESTDRWSYEPQSDRSRVVSFTSVSSEMPFQMPKGVVSSPPSLHRLVERSKTLPFDTARASVVSGSPLSERNPGSPFIDSRRGSLKHMPAPSYSSSHSSPHLPLNDSMISLPPPPRPRPNMSHTKGTSPVEMNPLPPPPRRPSRARPRTSHDRGSGRKPSFLDIDDDVDVFEPPRVDSSFLELDCAFEGPESRRSVNREDKFPPP